MHLHRSLSLLTVSISFALAGCGSDEDVARISEIADRPLSGTIGGQPWQIAGGDIAPFTASNSRYSAAFFDGPLASCDAEWPESGRLVNFELPRETGAFELTATDSISFATLGDISNGRSAESGLVVIESNDAVEGGRVRGGLRATVDASDTIEGRFDVRFCP